jgi:hypothetical protein
MTLAAVRWTVGVAADGVGTWSFDSGSAVADLMVYGPGRLFGPPLVRGGWSLAASPRTLTTAIKLDGRLVAATVARA